MSNPAAAAAAAVFAAVCLKLSPFLQAFIELAVNALLFFPSQIQHNAC